METLNGNGHSVKTKSTKPTRFTNPTNLALIGCDAVLNDPRIKELENAIRLVRRAQRALRCLPAAIEYLNRHVQ